MKDVAEFAKQQAMERGIEKASRIWDFVKDPLDVVLLSLMRAEGVSYSRETPEIDVQRYSREFSQTLKIDTQLCESRIRAINEKIIHIMDV